MQGVDGAQKATQATSHADMRRTAAADDMDDECRRGLVECFIVGGDNGDFVSDASTASVAVYGVRARLSAVTVARGRCGPRPLRSCCRW